MGYLIPIGLARSEAQLMFPDTAVVAAPTRTADGRGGQLITYDPTNTRQLPVIVTAARKGAYEKFGESVRPGTLFRLRFPFGSNIDVQSRITVSGTTYEPAPDTPALSYDVADDLFVVAIQ